MALDESNIFGLKHVALCAVLYLVCRIRLFQIPADEDSEHSDTLMVSEPSITADNEVPDDSYITVIAAGKAGKSSPSQITEVTQLPTSSTKSVNISKIKDTISNYEMLKKSEPSSSPLAESRSEVVKSTCLINYAFNILDSKDVESNENVILTQITNEIPVSDLDYQIAAIDRDLSLIDVGLNFLDSNYFESNQNAATLDLNRNPNDIHVSDPELQTTLDQVIPLISNGLRTPNSVDIESNQDAITSQKPNDKPRYELDYQADINMQNISGLTTPDDTSLQNPPTPIIIRQRSSEELSSNSHISLISNDSTCVILTHRITANDLKLNAKTIIRKSSSRDLKSSLSQESLNTLSKMTSSGSIETGATGSFSEEARTVIRKESTSFIKPGVKIFETFKKSTLSESVDFKIWDFGDDFILPKFSEVSIDLGLNSYSQTPSQTPQIDLDLPQEFENSAITFEMLESVSTISSSTLNFELPHPSQFSEPPLIDDDSAVYVESLIDAKKENSSLRFCQPCSKLSFFPSDLDPCTTHLYLEKNQIAIFPKTMTLLLSIRVLNLSENLLRNIPNELGLLDHLQDLNLSHNVISLIPTELSNLRKLQTLSLSHNLIRDLSIPSLIVDRDIFINMRELRHLDVTHNQLTHIPSSLGFITSLRRLAVCPNPFNEAHLALSAIIGFKAEFSVNRQISLDSMNFNGQKKRNRVPSFSSKKMESIPSLDGKRQEKTSILRLLGHLRDQYELEKHGSLTSHCRSWMLGRKGSFNYSHTSKPLELNPAQGVRERIINEILGTERTYVNELLNVYELYVLPIMRLHLLNSTQFQIVFSNLHDIIRLHKEYKIFNCSHLLPDLERVVSNTSSLGALFIDLSASLQIYQTYLNNWDLSNALLDWCQKLPQIPLFTYPPVPKGFSAFNLVVDPSTSRNLAAALKKAQEHSNHTQLNIFAYLIMPVQRLPRYKMLLETLLKKTPNTHPDFQNLKAASEVMSIKINELNESKRRWEKQLSNLAMLQRVLPQKYAINTSLLLNTTSSRELLACGQDLEFRLAKYVEINPSLQPTLLCKRSQFKKFAYKCTEYVFKLSDDPVQIYECSLPSYARWDVARVLGKKVILQLFNDMLVLCNSNGFLVLCIAIGPGTTAESMVLRGDIGMMRVCDGSCVVYIKGQVNELMTWTSLIHTCGK